MRLPPLRVCCLALNAWPTSRPHPPLQAPVPGSAARAAQAGGPRCACVRPRSSRPAAPRAMQHLTVERPPGRPWALLLIAKEPVNSMDTALWSALGAKLRELEGDASLRGLVVASGLARDVFTAGNDLKELYAPNTSAERWVAGRGGRGGAGLPVCIWGTGGDDGWGWVVSS